MKFLGTPRGAANKQKLDVCLYVWVSLSSLVVFHRLPVCSIDDSSRSFFQLLLAGARSPSNSVVVVADDDDDGVVVDNLVVSPRWKRPDITGHHRERERTSAATN